MNFRPPTISLALRKEALREYRKRNLVFWGLFIGWLPAIFVVGLLNFSPLTLTITLGWFIATFVTGIWRGNWKCPSCRRPFYYKWWYKNAFALNCVHCGYRPGQ